MHPNAWVECDNPCIGLHGSNVISIKACFGAGRILWCLAQIVAQAKQSDGTAGPCSHQVILLKRLSPLTVYKSQMMHLICTTWMSTPAILFCLADCNKQFYQSPGVNVALCTQYVSVVLQHHKSSEAHFFLVFLPHSRVQQAQLW